MTLGFYADLDKKKKSYKMKNKKPIADKDKQDSCAQACCGQKC